MKRCINKECKDCGAGYSRETDDYCGECGETLKEEAGIKRPECECGRRLVTRWHYCPSCGKDICVCKCGRNIIEDEKVVVIDEGKETEEHFCLACAPIK